MTLHAHTSHPAKEVTLLVLGAGWTYQFLQPLLDEIPSITYTATTSTGHDKTLEFKFDPESDDLQPFKKLPWAEYVLITFPLKGKGPSRKIVRMYEETHPTTSSAATGGDESAKPTKWIQLGSTGVYTAAEWVDCKTPIDPSNERGVAEDELISLGGCVLNLAGLYGAQRQPGNWIQRVAKTKEQLADKGALHLIHGVDVSRAIIAVVESPAVSNGLFGRRWIISDCVSYDWWQIVWDFNGESTEDGGMSDTSEALQLSSDLKKSYRNWVLELMGAKGVRGLPRSMEALGRKLDGREFWNAVGLAPKRSLKR